MVSTLDSGADIPGSSPGQGHRFVFLGRTLYSHTASLLHPLGVKRGIGKIMQEGGGGVPCNELASHQGE